MFSNLVVIVLLNLAYSTAFKSLPHPIRNKQSIYAVEHSDAFVSLKKSLSTIFIGAGIMFSPSASNYIANAAEAKAPPAATSAAPLKLIEEINYEGALLKRSTGKQRLADLNSEIKASKNKIYSLEKEVSRAETTVNKINTNLKNKNIDKVKMSDLQMEKEAQRTFIAEKKQMITSLERAIDRDTTEIKTLERRVKSDEENIKTRAEQLKKRKEELVKEAAEAKRNAIKKGY